MRCCFLSENKCAVKFNGEFLGFCGNNLSHALLCIKNALFEFIPTSEELLPTFISGEKMQNFNTPIPSKNTANVRIIDLCGGILILPRFLKAPKKRAIELINVGDGVSVCFFYAQTTQALIQSPSGYAFMDLGEIEKPSAKILSGGVLAVLGCGKKRKNLRLIDLSETPKLILARECDEFFFDEKLTVITKNLGICKIERREVFDLKNPQNSYSVFTRGVPIFSIKEELFPYAFLEEVFLKANFADYLSRDLKQSESLIPEFIGDFEFFLPPIFNKGITIIKSGKQKADFLQITAKNGCIEDLNFL